MAVMNDTDRADTARKLIRSMFEEAAATATLDTVEVRTLINDLDAFVDANAAAINTSITASVRSKASMPQKAMALAWVCLKRAGAI